MKLFLMVDNECKDPLRVGLPGRSKGPAFEGLSSVCPTESRELEHPYHHHRDPEKQEKQMTKQWLPSLYMMMLASLTIAGCASGSSQPTPIEPAVEPVEADTTPVAAAPRGAAFDANGNPYLPDRKSVV